MNLEAPPTYDADFLMKLLAAEYKDRVSMLEQHGDLVAGQIQHILDGVTATLTHMGMA